MADKKKENDEKKLETEENTADPFLPSSYFTLPKASSFWLTRIVFLRSLAFIYFIAFLVALNQNQALVGPRGLLPADLYLKRINAGLGKHATLSEKMELVPSLIWFTNFNSPASLTTALDLFACLGLILSAWVFIHGCANMFIMFALWVLYHSIVNLGQRWYSFGWESQLLETGFLAIFMCPLRDFCSKAPKHLSTPESVVLLYRWLIFRIMIGAGLIKIRGDRCWHDLTCMHYHYETQPVPNPISTFMHQSPEWFHNFEVATNHFVELIAPFLLVLVPFRSAAVLGGLIQVMFQVVLIISGNLSFLNWLTILPAIFCFDDKFFRPFFAKSMLMEVKTAAIEQCYGRHLYSFAKKGVSLFYSFMHWGIFLLIAYLSIPVVQNLLSSRQLMNTSFDSFRIVNTYGAFGSITKRRTEVVFEGTRALNPEDRNAVWLEYEFPCKPGNITRRPCLISPYHYRLDWLMWFSAFQTYQHNPWLLHLAGKMLDNDVKILNELLAYNPFDRKGSPKWVRARHYSYRYSTLGSPAWKRGQWWIRTDEDNFYLPPVNKDMLQKIYEQFGWTN